MRERGVTKTAKMATSKRVKMREQGKIGKNEMWAVWQRKQGVIL